jgi:hypothetical protein
VALTFGDHIADTKSKKIGSLLFLFGQILVTTILFYQNKLWINCCCCLTNNVFKKPKITHRLQLFCSHLQYASNVDKKYEKKNGVGFVIKC